MLLVFISKIFIHETQSSLPVASPLGGLRTNKIFKVVPDTHKFTCPRHTDYTLEGDRGTNQTHKYNIDWQNDWSKACSITRLTLCITLCESLGSAPGHVRHIVTYSFMSSLFCHPDTRHQLRWGTISFLSVDFVEEKKKVNIYCKQKN